MFDHVIDHALQNFEVYELCFTNFEHVQLTFNFLFHKQGDVNYLNEVMLKTT